MGSEKTLGKWSRKDVKRVFIQYHNFKVEVADFSQFLRENPVKTESVEPWAHLYEIPFERLIAIFILGIGWGDHVLRIAKESNPMQAWLNFSDEQLGGDVELDDEFEQEFERALPLFMALLKALIGNLKSVSIYSVPVSTLITNAEKGDDKALFRAILIDRMCLQTQIAIERTSRAELIADEGFFDQLGRSVKGSLGQPPKPEHDDLRFMLEAINDFQTLSELRQEDLYDVLARDLQLYGKEGKDSLEGFRKMIQKRHKMTRN